MAWKYSVFHVNPLGMSGAPYENWEEDALYLLDELKKCFSHIQKLGCTREAILGLYLNPPRLWYQRLQEIGCWQGNNEYSKAFAEQAHGLGMKIMVDSVLITQSGTSKRVVKTMALAKERNSD